MYPSLEEMKQLNANNEYRRIPVCKELFADRFTPIEVLRTLKAAHTQCYLLESAEDNKTWGRYSFLGYQPVLELVCRDSLLTIRHSSGKEAVQAQTLKVSHPRESIRHILTDYYSPLLPDMPPFTGGLVGYFSYEYIKYAENTLSFSSASPDNAASAFCDVDLMLFDKVIVFDHYRQKLILVAGVSTDSVDASYEKAIQDLNDIEKLIKSDIQACIPPLVLKGALTSHFSKEDYCSMVERAKSYIREGDIFQVVLSNPLTAPAEGSLFDTYRVLRTSNPSPYMFYFSSEQMEIAGASPETLAKLENGALKNFPLAGTRPRGKTKEEDEALEKELLSDEKELAEHNMLVDLGRNDLGRVCELGSVKVEKYCGIERFSHVMHIGSTVTGTLQKDKDALDAIDSILPAGTLSGAPKLRACEIIHELEKQPRGIYGGAIGYLDFSGNMDTCIAIRLAYKKGGTVCVQSGAGIVADSIPENEYAECHHKARAVVNAIALAEGSLP